MSQQAPSDSSPSRNGQVASSESLLNGSTSQPISNGSTSEVLHSSPSDPEAKIESEDPRCKIFIGGIPWAVSDEAFYDYFSQFGEVTRHLIIREKSGRSRGFGFVTYVDPAAAQHVIDLSQQRSLTLLGRCVDASQAVPPGGHRVPHSHSGEDSASHSSGGGSMKVFVGGLPQNVREPDLLEYFSQFGNVTDTMVLIDPETGRSRGFGFVRFDSSEPVQQVINVRNHVIKDKRVECKQATPRRGVNNKRRPVPFMPAPVPYAMAYTDMPYSDLSFPDMPFPDMPMPLPYMVGMPPMLPMTQVVIGPNGMPMVVPMVPPGPAGAAPLPPVVGPDGVVAAAPESASPPFGPMVPAPFVPAGFMGRAPVPLPLAGAVPLPGVAPVDGVAPAPRPINRIPSMEAMTQGLKEPLRAGSVDQSRFFAGTSAQQASSPKERNTS